MEATRRQLLNEGEQFPGFLEERRTGEIRVWVGTHPDLGVAAYPEIPVSLAENKIEVRYGNGSKVAIMKRNAFFGRLLSIPPPSRTRARRTLSAMAYTPT